jgi:mono/diheme cytochrome c family protein
MRTRQSALSAVTATLVLAALTPIAAARLGGQPVLIGNADRGALIFNNAGCAACHDYDGAGPSLSHLTLTEQQIIREVAEGGRGVMGAAASRYILTMQGAEDFLSTAQIDDVSAYVYERLPTDRRLSAQVVFSTPNPVAAGETRT